MRLPAAVETIAARRVGAEVYVTLTIPAVNVDESVPPSVQRVEVYGVTGTAPPPRAQFLASAARVAVIEVPAPPLPGEAVPAAGSLRPAPGESATVVDALGDDELAAATGEQSPSGLPRRFYMAIAFSDRGPSPAGTVVEVPLAPVPNPPASLELTYSADAAILAWQPRDPLMAFLLERGLPPEPPPPGIDLPPPAPPVPEAEGPVLYNVYRDIAPDPLVLPSPTSAAAALTPPLPLNRTPLAALTYTDPLVLDERQRCYTVRAVRGAPTAVVESEASPRQCVTPLDVFPPAMPARLDTIASENAVSLIWEPGTEPDLGGYVVLRGEAGGDTLAPLTPEPIRDAQFTDETVVPGVRYVYHVVAVDRRLPLPNASAPAIIEATAR